MSRRTEDMLRPSRLLLLLVAVTLFFYCCLPVPAAAQDRAEAHRNIIVNTEETGGEYFIRVQNENPFDITVTLRVGGQNFKTSQATPCEFVLGPGEENATLRINRVDKTQSIEIRTNYNWVMGDIHARHDDSYRYRLPFAGGKAYRVGQSYGGSFSHTGPLQYAVDFDMPEGTPVYAARGGLVAAVTQKHRRGGAHDDYREQANLILIMHDDGTYGEYAHLRFQGAAVSPGDRVRRGQLIGYSGNTGYSSGPHLHFMVTRSLKDGSSRSLPVHFETKEGVFRELQEGHTYTAVP